MAAVLKKNIVNIAFFGDERIVFPGGFFKRTKRLVSVPVGSSLLGRVIDFIGNPIDKQGVLSSYIYNPLDIKAAGIIFRSPVNEAMLTGLKMVDSMIPIGRGQRELVIGDMKLGKTSIAIDTIINQR
jgi:F0F1-type ATP synthase alpha subunit